MNEKQKAKAYDEALKKVKPLYEQAKRDGNPIWSTYEYLIPELKESEDERIYNEIMSLVKDGGCITSKKDRELAIAYLEKQKENPKNAISIPADCATNAKCPYKIHGDEDFIGDIKDTPAYHFGFDEGVRSEREKQKEQKPELVQQPPITYTYPSDASRDERLKAALLALLNSDLIKVAGNKFTKQDLIEWVERIPTDKPTEWSEEDADILNCCISSIEEAKENRYAYKETDGDTSYDREIDWLKSIRPSWKPSEEQMDALNALNCHGDLSYVGQQNQLISLYNDLKKLM